MKTIRALCLVAFVAVVMPCALAAAQAAAQPVAPDEIQSALDMQKINFSFKNKPLRDVVARLRTLTMVNILYYPLVEEDVPITVNLDGVSLRTALDTICAMGKHDLAFEVIENVVVIADRPTLIILKNKKPLLPANPTAEEAETLRKLDEKVDFSFKSGLFEDTTMQNAAQFLSSQTHVTITASLPHEGAFPNIDMALARVPLHSALFHLSGLKYNYGVFGSEILISSEVGLALRRAK
jgi:hypothetical protein